MKRTSVYVLSLLMLSLAGCTDKFDEINTDPNQATEQQWDPNFFLPNAQNNYVNLGYDQMLYQGPMLQVLASTFTYYGNGDKYVNTQNSTSYQGAIFNRTYSTGTTLAEMIRLSKDKPQYANLYQIGRILQAMNVLRGTDTYGDIPYTQAFQAKAGTTAPKYDTQQSIYTALLKEIDEATAALDVNQAAPTGDMIYSRLSSSTAKMTAWKKFGYSLMLRTAMRLIKVDAATAKTYAEKAIAGGVFTSNDDNAYIQADANYAASGIYNVYQVTDDYRELRFAKTFIDALKSTSDPRLSAVAEVPQTGAANNANKTLSGDNTAASQLGLPNGYDLASGATDIRKSAGYPGPSPAANDKDSDAPLGKYSRPRISVYLKKNGTMMVLSYAEVEFLLAEAKVRGWNVSGTAADHYKNGIVAAMTSLIQLDASAEIKAEAAQTWAAAHPLDVTSTDASLKAINTQFWLATGTMFNFIEAWSNWRRTGYPVLTPINYPGNVTGSTIPRRMIYLSTEISTNPTSYTEAVNRLSGGDLLTSRVWWDK
ncbi:SusD/RagB family nutrient-binding outer membrane lipoprotein [Siphonobacter aquaeclarae]|uniref:Starch-binding associating with outer membrane n=1 Tax=Siphonobacter aquaeclarae TaxID=563176 RepID=A0A1G9QB36_9BACT|nr:SusD/RagB family nutrient-binding outer membrane lipoprotein [Siphonobacter aquaeclarae]SDM08288.1 Starch-binding associating with outer membrane [Siphonobacter aquaeclarae]